MRLLTLMFPVLLLTACGGDAVSPENSGNLPSSSYQIPPAGTLVVADSIKHVEGGLNSFTFRVTITKAPERGVYNVQAQDGPNNGETQFTLPKGGENFQVVMRKGSGENRMEIGFKVPGDPEFYPYYEVVSEGKTIRAQYTHAYRFERD